MRLAAAAEGGDVLGLGAGVLTVFALVLPVAAVSYLLVRLVRTAVSAAWTRSSVAFQVVLVLGQSDVQVPLNAAVAGNRDCVECLTAALAVQLVVALESAPTAAVEAELAGAFAKLEGLEELTAELDLAAVAQGVQEVQAEVLAILVRGGLVDEPSAAAAVPSVSPSPSSTASTRASPEASPDPDASPQPSSGSPRPTPSTATTRTASPGATQQTPAPEPSPESAAPQESEPGDEQSPAT